MIFEFLTRFLITDLQPIYQHYSENEDLQGSENTFQPFLVKFGW